MMLLAACESIGVKGFMHPDELEQLAFLATNRDVLEVGSFMGLSAFCMAIVAKSVQCVDTFKANSAGQQQMSELTTYNAFVSAISRFNNVRHIVATSEQAALVIPSDYDMVFLDAMHTYENVKADLERWWPRIRPGGLLVCHDYGHDHFPGVKQAVDERFGPQTNTVGTLMWMSK